MMELLAAQGTTASQPEMPRFGEYKQAITEYDVTETHSNWLIISKGVYASFGTHISNPDLFIEAAYML